MKIAFIITGRIAMYEIGLLHTLKNSNHEIDVFMSLNGEDCEYYDVMKTRLKPWLKYCNIQNFKLDKEFCEKIKPNNWPNRTHCRYVDNYFVPYNVMSMYYNEKIAINQAINYADDKNFEYDCYFKYRSDLLNVIIKDDLPIKKDGLHLFSPIPNCQFITHGIHKVPTACGSWAWGNRETMKIYCNTYDYVIKKTEEMDGNFFISFECSLMDNLVDNNVTYEFIDYPYYYVIYDKTLPDYMNSVEKYSEIIASKHAKL